jgi:hypothetical protein
MREVAVCRTDDFEDFCEETESRWPDYLDMAQDVINRLTRRDLHKASMHPDGFVRLPIGPDEWWLNGQLRLHFWLPGRANPSQPHLHPWHLASYTISGAYREYLPELRKDDAGEVKRFAVIYEPASDMRARIEMLGTERFKIFKGRLYETSQGNTHYLPRGRVHMSAQPISWSVTLAVTSPRFADESIFFSGNMSPQNWTLAPSDLDLVMKIASTIRQ